MPRALVPRLGEQRAEEHEGGQRHEPQDPAPPGDEGEGQEHGHAHGQQHRRAGGHHREGQRGAGGRAEGGGAPLLGGGVGGGDSQGIGVDRRIDDPPRPDQPGLDDVPAGEAHRMSGEQREEREGNVGEHRADPPLAGGVEEDRREGPQDRGGEPEPHGARGCTGRQPSRQGGGGDREEHEQGGRRGQRDPGEQRKEHDGEEGVGGAAEAVAGRDPPGGGDRGEFAEPHIAGEEGATRERTCAEEPVQAHRGRKGGRHGEPGRDQPTPTRERRPFREFQFRGCSPEGGGVRRRAALLALLAGDLPRIGLEFGEGGGREDGGPAEPLAGGDPQIGPGQDGRTGGELRARPDHVLAHESRQRAGRCEDQQPQQEERDLPPRRGDEPVVELARRRAPKERAGSGVVAPTAEWP